MSSTALKMMALGVVGLALVLGIVAYQMSQSLTPAPDTAQAPPPEPAEDQVLAVVATARLPAYEPIVAESVRLVPVSVAPEQYYRSVDAVVGRAPLRSVPVGSPVTEQAFGASNTLAQAIPEGTQAMSLEISDVIAVGGFVKPGDIVDVLVYIRSSGQEVEDTQARVLLKKARLLSYEERLINAGVEDKEDAAGQRRRERTAVIAVPEKQTTRVMLGASLGDLRLALNGIEDRNLGRAGDGEGQQPEALAPDADSATTEVAANAAKDQDEDKGKDAEEEEDVKTREKVITLAELTEIEKKKRPRNAPKPPPRATIEVFQGADSTKISRPY